MKKKIILSFAAFCIFAASYVSINATTCTSCQDKESAVTVTSITLEVDKTSSGNLLTWKSDGYAALGFKINVSTKNPEPTYPVMTGDSYIYLTDPNIRDYLHKDTDSTKTYYYRVCAYLGGKCGVYSNAVKVSGSNSTCNSNENSYCTMEYSPVCGLDGKTYSNKCIAEKSCAGIQYEGECKVEEKCEEGTCDSEIPPAGYEDEVLTAFDANPFPDTDIKTLSGMAAAELYRRAVIGGYPDGEFKGDREVNRAEAAKFLILARYGEIGDYSNNGKFPDVLDGQWYTKYVIKASILGIINGHPDGNFKPADSVNTAEFLVMLAKTFGLDLGSSHSYSDVPEGEWYADFAGIAENYGLFPDRIGELKPAQNLTRSEVAVAIYQFLKNR